MERFLDYFAPEHYALELTLLRAENKIRGLVTISGEIKSDFTKLHAAAMDIKSVKLADGSDCDFEYDDAELLIKNLTKGTATFTIDFETKFNENMQGCYLSTYEFEGATQELIATQFESHYAREAFPCIDEPAAKATFDLTLIIPDFSEDDVALANTPLRSTTENRFEFSRTPRMSTYLLAWVVGPLKKVSTVNKNGVAVASYAALNQPAESLIFANEVAARALEYYDEKFGIKYPLEKLDQVALPDFEAGAMENWGLVTYRESMMLADRDSSFDVKRSVATTVTHELSHQWFGNLVTMEWWDDLWLNESFATVIEYFCADALYPELKVWQDFFTDDCLAALRRDCLPGVQAVKQPVHSPAEIATLFDGAIVYAKGARLILMLMRLMGEANFDKGLRDYFEKFSYKNTVGDDLWSALQPYADFDVKDFMDAWISQPGYPALKKSQLSPDNLEANPAPQKLSPEANPAPQKLSPEADPVPKGFRPTDRTPWAQQRLLIDGSTDETQWPLPDAKNDMSGHYLIDLSPADFQQYLADFDRLDLEQRLRLLIDRMLLAKATVVSAASLLDLLPKFRSETSAAVLEIIANIIADLKLFCPPEPESAPANSAENAASAMIAENPALTKTADNAPAANYKKFLYNIYSPRFAEISLEPTRDTDAVCVRDVLLSIARYTEDETVTERLIELYRDDFAEIDSELRAHVLAAKLKRDESLVFDTWLEKYQSETDPEIKRTLLAILASETREPAYLDQLLALLEKTNIVRPQDHIFLYIYLLRNYRTRLRTLQWLTEHWDFVVQLTGDKSLEDYPRYAANVIRTADEARLFHDFFDPKIDDPALTRTLNVAKVEIAARLSLIANDGPRVAARLQELI